MRALIDADILIYRYSYRNHEVIEWDEDTITDLSDIATAKRELDAYVEWIIERTKVDNYVMVLSGSNNFRFEVMKSYKGNRKDTEKPALYNELKKHVMDNHPCKIRERLEGDDVMGIMSTRHPGKSIICSIDKDMLQIPGEHFNWKHDEFTTVTLDEGNSFFYTQCLTGDSTDGYCGCPGIGKKRAEKILAKADYEYSPAAGVSREVFIWKAIVSTYEDNGLDEEFALKQARMARILRASDFDFKSGQVVLWTPT